MDKLNESETWYCTDHLSYRVVLFFSPHSSTLHGYWKGISRFGVSCLTALQMNPPPSPHSNAPVWPLVQPEVWAVAADVLTSVPHFSQLG